MLPTHQTPSQCKFLPVLTSLVHRSPHWRCQGTQTQTSVFHTTIQYLNLPQHNQACVTSVGGEELRSLVISVPGALNRASNCGVPKQVGRRGMPPSSICPTWLRPNPMVQVCEQINTCSWIKAPKLFQLACLNFWFMMSCPFEEESALATYASSLASLLLV